MRPLFNLLLIVFSLQLSVAQNVEEAYHRAKVFYSNVEDIQQLRDAGITMDHGLHRTNVFFESDFSESELETIKQLGLNTQIVIHDVRAFYINQNNPEHKDYVATTQTRNATCTNSGGDYQTPVNFDVKNGDDFGGYYTYSEALQEFADMHTQYPNLITAAANINNGSTDFLTEGDPNNATSPSIGSNPIKWFKISDNPNSSSEGEPQILYTAIHHAREPMSLQQLIFYMWYLLENYDTDLEVQSIVNNTELYFVPVINPDGYLHNEFTDPQGGGFWRKNRHNGYGVDNNRNYDYYINGDANNGSWGGPGSSANTNSEVHHGSGPFSEIENQAIKAFVEQHDFVIALNNHTFGQLIYYPFGYADLATPDDATYEGITSLLTSVNGYNAFRDSPYAGDSDDFMYGTVGTHDKIFAMTPEIGTSFWPAASAIESTCKDMMFTNLSAAQLAGNYATIQDNTSNFLVNTSSNIDYTLQRLGLQDPANFTVSINPISANISSVGAPNVHNNLSYLQEINANISISLNPSIQFGDQITYELVVDNGLFSKTYQETKTFGVPILLIDELANDTTTNWAPTDWAITSEDFNSAPSSITDSPNTIYSNNENKTIALSNTLDLSAASAAILSFYAKWNVEANYDYVQVEVSTNNGNNWLPQCGNYTNTGVSTHGSASGEPLYDGVQNDWINENIDLSDYLGETILIRFQLVTDNVQRRDGFYFDDLQVQIIDPSLSTSEFNTNEFSVYPNPVNTKLTIQTTQSDYTISVHNLQGQHIYSATNNSGNSLVDYSNYAKGIYVLQIKSKTASKTFKIIKN
jgi:hypothetical protein